MEIIMPDNVTLSDSIVQHINDSMALALATERYPLWKHACPELTDIDFIRLSLHRTISAVIVGGIS